MPAKCSTHNTCHQCSITLPQWENLHCKTNSRPPVLKKQWRANYTAKMTPRPPSLRPTPNLQSHLFPTGDELLWCGKPRTLSKSSSLISSDTTFLLSSGEDLDSKIAAMIPSLQLEKLWRVDPAQNLLWYHLTQPQLRHLFLGFVVVCGTAWKRLKGMVSLSALQGTTPNPKTCRNISSNIYLHTYLRWPSMLHEYSFCSFHALPPTHLVRETLLECLPKTQV